MYFPLKTMVSVVMICASFLYTNTMNADKTKQDSVLQHIEEKQIVLSQFLAIKSNSDKEFLKSKFNFDIDSCDYILNNKLPYQDVYKKCVNDIKTIESELISAL